jgi:hypothetical protein
VEQVPLQLRVPVLVLVVALLVLLQLRLPSVSLLRERLGWRPV